MCLNNKMCDYFWDLVFNGKLSYHNFITYYQFLTSIIHSVYAQLYEIPFRYFILMYFLLLAGLKKSKRYFVLVRKPKCLCFDIIKKFTCMVEWLNTHEPVCFKPAQPRYWTHAPCSTFTLRNLGQLISTNSAVPLLVFWSVPKLTCIENSGCVKAVPSRFDI